MAAYIGHLSTTSGDGPEVVLKIEGTDVIVVMPDEKLHVWPVDLVRITGVSSPRFKLSFDGDVAVFTAHHPSRFLFEFIPALEAARDTLLDADSPIQDGATQPEDDRVDSEGGRHQPEVAAIENVSLEPEPPPTRLRGSHWSNLDGTAISSLLKAAATSRNRPRPARKTTEPDHESNGEAAPETSPAPLPRRRGWLRRESSCPHVWVPRTIAGRSAQICTECSEVVLTDKSTGTVIDLTDRALGNGSDQSNTLRDRLTGRTRRKPAEAARQDD